MVSTASVTLEKRNPDILNSIANLSNDEVFTPPEFANQMLDTLEKAWAESNNGANIWEDPNVTFLDPFTKSGVFLREIVARLTVGLEQQFPDVQKRVDHILTKQVFGIAITQLTALMARRSVYCSKHANGKHSITKKFDSEEGNIHFPPTEHEWVGGKKTVETAGPDGSPITIAVDGKCKFCGATQKTLDRGEGLETHAYSFIHTNDIKSHIKEMFGEDMQFDVIIGNPPYQLETGGGPGRQAKPVYHKFVEQAKTLEPRFLVMVIPSRWFTGGLGLDQFRSTMLNEKRISTIVDFVNGKDAFPNVNINGGVNYFVWSRDFVGECSVKTVMPGGIVGETLARPLDEFDVFIRHNDSLRILRKVLKKSNDTFDSRVSAISPFGLDTKFKGASSPSKSKNIKIFGSGHISWASEEDVRKNRELIGRWKVLVGQATDGNEIYPLPIWDQKGPFVSMPGEACSWTYLIASLADTEQEAVHIVEYMRTKFFRFLVWLRKPTQHNKADNFSFVPEMPMNRVWSDKDLYRYFGLDSKDVDFIEEMIREMDWVNDKD